MPLHSILRCSINSQPHLVCTHWLWGRGKVIEAVRSKVPTAVKQPLQHRAHTGAVASRLWQKDEPTYVNAASASNSSVKTYKHTRAQLLGYKQSCLLRLEPPPGAQGSEEDGAAASVTSRKPSQHLQVSPCGASFSGNTAVRKHIFTQVWLSVARDLSTQFAYRWGWELISVCSWI